MPRKYNTKHQRSPSAYKAKVKAEGPSRQPDPMLSDGKRASAKR